MNQRQIGRKSLKKATYWMQPETVEWLRAVSESSGLSQGAILNVILLDYQLRQIPPERIAQSFRLRDARQYCNNLLGAISPTSYRIP